MQIYIYLNTTYKNWINTEFISATKYSNEYYSFDTFAYYVDSTYIFLKIFNLFKCIKVCSLYMYDKWQKYMHVIY